MGPFDSWTLGSMSLENAPLASCFGNKSQELGHLVSWVPFSLFLHQFFHDWKMGTVCSV